MARPKPHTVAARDQALAALRQGPLTTGELAARMPLRRCRCLMSGHALSPRCVCKGSGQRPWLISETYAIVVALERLGLVGCERVATQQNVWFYAPASREVAEVDRAFGELLEQFRRA